MNGRSFLIASLAFVVLVIGADFYMPALLSFLRRVAQVKMAEGAARAYSSGSLSIVYVMVPDMETAKTLAKPLVQNKQVACINIIPHVTSIYEWEGQMEESSELVMLMKTATSKVDEISEFIRKNHPYDVAAVVSTKIDNGNPPFLDWISDTVGDKPEPAAKKSRSNDQ
ncbi:divalent-cation tolerance protein CutA [Aplysia californica]|uniref:Divalent-cation tolerance protein CutA n=1 Tax=Aplysia californica TaxID=6500 RepID=A0ABM1A6D3_APLCA|nr:divalent-cation tolerance protein CutA [Aplysia californica]